MTMRSPLCMTIASSLRSLLCAPLALAIPTCKQPPPPEPTAVSSADAPATADAAHDAATGTGPPVLVPEGSSDPSDATVLTLLGAADAATVDEPIAVDGGLRRAWRKIKGHHFQIVSAPGEPTEVTDANEGNRGACPPGMVEVAGKMIDEYFMDQRQQQICTKWINRDFPERCAVFDRNKWLGRTTDFRRKPMHFCIDRYEYPNRRGEFPLLFVNWIEANELCEADGKRLCTETEWTFACEGEEATPYPYGYVRDPDACVVDKTWIPYYPKAFATLDGTMHELDRLWKGIASGTQPRCKSVFGVYDMVGNVDEWTRSSSPKGRPSVLKGGYWGKVRTRCRPSTRAHGELHAFYQQGLRCCASLP